MATPIALSFAGFDDRLNAHAKDLRATVLHWTGIPVSVGIGPTKMLAKVANRTAKKQPGRGGVCNLMHPNDQLAALAVLTPTDLWGIAGRMAKRLEHLGIDTPLKLRNADPSHLTTTSAW